VVTLAKRTTGSYNVLKSGSSSTINRIVSPAWRVASHARAPHPSAPHTTCTSSAVATPPRHNARNACRRNPVGASAAPATNAVVTSTVYAAITAARRPPGRANSARLVTPRMAAAMRVRVERSGAAASSAAQGSPTRLGGAQAAKAMTPTTRRHRLGCMLRGVPLDVRNQGELARPLDGGRELALVPRAHPGEPARQNLAALREKASQGAVVLVVDHPGAGLAHGTGLG